MQSSSELPSETPFPRLRGRIKELRVDWGFIEGEDGKDYFLYCRSMRRDSGNFRSLRIGHLVEFTPTYPDRGPRAEEVLKLSQVIEN